MRKKEIEGGREKEKKITDKLEWRRTSRYSPSNMKSNGRYHEFRLEIVQLSWSTELSIVQSSKSKHNRANKQPVPNHGLWCLSNVKGKKKK